MDPDQRAQLRNLIRIHAVHLPTLLQQMRRLVWIHAGSKPIMLVLSWHGSFIVLLVF
jgi:hypothetical protein